MDRSYTPKELSTLVQYCIEAHMDLLPYYCRENKVVWADIKRSAVVVKKYNITPERFWHGNENEFTWLLVLLSRGYPSPNELLRLAERGTSGEIKSIASHHYQYVAAMFDFVKSHHGYVVLRPTEYMVKLYPHAEGMLYVYTREKWAHNELADISGVVLIIHNDELGQLPGLLKKKLGIIQ
jgi:hypothetical protein